LNKDTCVSNGVDDALFERLLKGAVMQKPVGVATKICAFPGIYAAWPSAYNGIIQKGWESTYCPRGARSDHVQVLVGYGVDESVTTREFPKGMPYWKLRNSWGTRFGEDGYFKVVMKKGIIGLNTYPPCFPRKTAWSYKGGTLDPPK